MDRPGRIAAVALIGAVALAGCSSSEEASSAVDEAASPNSFDDDFEGTVVDMSPVNVGPGEGSIVIDIALPADHKVNDEAPSQVTWRQRGDVAELPAEPSSLKSVVFPVAFPTSFRLGSGSVVADVELYWCHVDDEDLCFTELMRLTAPVVVDGSASGDIRLAHTLMRPDGR